MSLDLYLEYDRCPECGRAGSEAHWQNITHNLVGMAAEAGIYDILWRPEESGISTADQLVPLLEAAIAEMRKDPERFRRHDARNGWGTYDQFVPWLERLVVGCSENPKASVRASR